MPTIILHIALPIPLHSTFDYLPPQHDDAPAIDLSKIVGCRARVNFNNRPMIGIIVATGGESSTAFEKLKHVEEILDASPLVSKEFIHTCRWAANYYMHPFGDALLSALPPLFRKEKYALKTAYWTHTHEGKGLPNDALKGKKKQQEIHRFLLEHKQISKSSLDLNGFSKSALKTLADKGIIQRIEDDVRPGQNATDLIAADVAHDTLFKETPKMLNTEQQKALQSLRLHDFNCSLLHGATGSGKTEVYLQLAAKALQVGRQVLVLVPEIGLSPQTVERFRRRFHVNIVELHSDISEHERAKNWIEAHTKHAKIIIGTRLAAFAPAPELGLIIIDEEHDSSFKQQDGFRYSARDCCIYRAKTASIPIVLGSATPSLETLHNAQQLRYQHLVLRERAGNAQAPEFHMVDLRKQTLQAGIAEEGIRDIAETLKRGEQALIFLNRRGYAPVQLCHACGWVSECPNCSASMTVHSHPPRLHCHHCDRKQKQPTSCPNCGHFELSSQGIGTEQLELLLSDLFPSFPVLRVDRDAARSKKQLAEKLALIHTGQPSLLIGTQMLAKGHHFPKLTLVVVIDADQGFLNPDFRAMEKMGQLLMQVSGRAGREEDRGKVLIQTHRPDHPLLQMLINAGYNRFAREILEERKLAMLPPFWHCALFRAESKRADNALALLKQLSVMYQRYFPPSKDTLVIGPMPSTMEKVQDRFRFQLMIKSADRKELRQRLTTLISEIEKSALSKRVRWSIDIDPTDT